MKYLLLLLCAVFGGMYHCSSVVGDSARVTCLPDVAVGDMCIDVEL